MAQAITNKELSDQNAVLQAKVDQLGEQLNWITTNCAGLFEMVGQFASLGPAGLIGLMKGVG